VLILLGLHAVAATLLVLVAGHIGRRALPVAGGVMLSTVIWALAVSGRVFGGEVLVTSFEWVPALGLGIDIVIDGLALVMVLLISAVGVLVAAYSWWYFGDEPRLGQFAGLLLAFAGAMLGIVVADNLLFLFVFWEITSVASFLLIGFRDTEAQARSSALQALLVTGAGGLVMLAGIVLLGLESGTLSMRGLLADPPTTTAAVVGILLVLVGAFSKSAQVPFHFWLPGAMAAPTPVSAYLHSATMVKAGVFLIARFSPAYAEALDFWVPLVVAVGLTTMIVGGVRALYQTDLKLLLALGTVSQLGFLVALFGTGDIEIGFAAFALLLAHGVFKAALFMIVGVVDHQAHTRDLRRLSGIGRVMPGAAALAAVATASMVGIPLLFGFVAKEAVFEGLLHWPDGASTTVTVVVVLGSALTAAYGGRFLWGTFGRKREDEMAGEAVDAATVARPSPWFLAPAGILVAATVAWGVFPGVLDAAVGASTDSVHGVEHALRLAAWHGFGAPLALSVTALGLGAGVFVAVRRGAGVGLADRARRGLPTPTSAYWASLVGLNRIADRTTAIVQPGSLPFYAGVILITVLLLPGVWLVRSLFLPDGLVLAESPIQVAAALAVVVGALGAAVAVRRIGAVIFLGAAGYGVALVFVVQGAPDLALTQVLIETLTIAIFILVIRLLPEHFERGRWLLQRVWRVTIAAALGLFVAAFTVIAAASRTVEPISAEYVERALPEAGGGNIVNVILTDFRSLDTLGEITVLVVAALGILALVRAGRDGSDEEETEVS
jgi:multicomponent Na+:H+ antiporter subunit A